MHTKANEVLAQVAKDLKSRGLSHAHVAQDLNYRMRQSIGNILSAGKYMTPAQAKRFNEAYGYYEPFLTSGEGTLFGPVEDVGTTFFLPQHVLLLRPFENVEEFGKAFDSFMQSMVATYDINDIQRFLNAVVKYLGVMEDPIGEYDRLMELVGRNVSIRDTIRAKLDPSVIDEAETFIRSAALGNVYNCYNKMTKNQ